MNHPPPRNSWLRYILFFCVMLFQIGCVIKISSDSQPKNGLIENKLNFLDISKFDKDLAASLSSDLNEVNVFFYSKVSPNKLPDRIQHWISAAESAGGKIRVEQPPNEPAPRAIIPLLSLLGTAYSDFKNRLVSKPEIYLNAVKGRNVVIVLDRGPVGDLLVEKIQFIK